jgi:cupin superfamily acireductone dioxygenase involved in methionine salvage
MIVREFYDERMDGVKLYRTYSDANKYIQKIGTTEVYSEAIDVENAPYKYEETDKEIEQYEELIEDITRQRTWREYAR